MLRTIWEYLGNHGYGVMLVGMAVVVAAVVLMMRGRQGADPLTVYVWPLAIVGLAIYVVGRVAVALRGRRKDSKSSSG